MFCVRLAYSVEWNDNGPPDLEFWLVPNVQPEERLKFFNLCARQLLKLIVTLNSSSLIPVKLDSFLTPQLHNTAPFTPKSYIHSDLKLK